MSKFRATRLSLIAALLLAAPVLAPLAAHADSYTDAVPQLEIAGGAKTCVSCFLEKYAPAEMPKAFAVSRDGAFGGRWKRSLSLEEVKRDALASCRKKDNYNAANPCVVFFENDQLVWKP